MEKILNNKWARMFGLWSFFQLILLTYKVIPLSFYPAIIFQGVLFVGLFYWLDKRYLGIFPKLYDQSLPFGKQLLAALGLMLFMGFVHVGNIGSVQSKNLLVATVVSLEAGIMEEYIFRGILLGELLKDGKATLGTVLLGTIATSLLFGLSHMSNIFYQPLDYTLFQVCMTALLGTLFAATYLRTRSLIWVMFFHFLQDFIVIGINGMATPDIPEAVWIGVIVLSVIILPIVFVLLRPKKIQDIATGFERA
ncbi:CPBP family intramembrane glutamic endopeptidase [Streptococcus cameli]